MNPVSFSDLCIATFSYLLHATFSPLGAFDDTKYISYMMIPDRRAITNDDPEAACSHAGFGDIVTLRTRLCEQLIF